MRASVAAVLFTFLLSRGASGQVPEGDLAALLPPDTMVFLGVDDVSRLFTLDPDGAIRTLLRHDAVKQAFEQVHETFGVLEDKDFLLALNVDEEELVRLFNGRVTVAIPEIVLERSEVEASSQGGPQADVRLGFELGRGVVLMADFSATRERFEELLENVAALVRDEEDVHRAKVVIDEFEGVKLYTIEVEKGEGELDEPTWLALVDQLLLVSDREETLKDFVDVARHGAADGDRLVDDPRYTDARDRAGPSDALLYVNLAELLPMVNEFIRFQLAKAGDDIEMFLRVDDLIASLRLDAIKSMFAAGRVADDEAGLVFGFTHAETERGLHTLLAYDDAGVEIPPYFSSDFHSASITTFDVSEAWKRFDEMLNKASPWAHTMLKTQIGQLENTGFELRAAVLENCDGLLVEFVGYPEATQAGPDDHPTQAYVIRVRDPQTLEESLSALADELADEEPIEFMNERIYELPFPMAVAFNAKEPKISFSVVENNAVVAIGDPKMVENVIAHLKNPGASLLDDADLMDAFDALPSDDVVGIGFIDVADVLENSLRGGQQAFRVQASRERNRARRARLEGAEKIMEELPDVSDLQYFVATKTYSTPDSFVVRMLLRKNLDS